MFVHHDGYDVFYETFGDAAHTPLLLINGFTSQSVSWPDDLRDALVAAEFFVITFDNRDVGLSTKSAPGQHYLLSDMASDAVAVLDALDVSAPVVWGTSMGGMIAQTLTIDHPSRVAALCSVMSTTGNQEVGRPTSEALEALMTPPPEDREGAIAAGVRVAHVIGGPLVDPEWEQVRAARQYDRCFWPQGAAHQMHAITKSGDRTAALGAVQCPTTVIHGRVDPLITLSGGEATAAAIPGARLVVLDDMGHDMPEPLWPVLVDSIVSHTLNAD